MSCSRVVEQGGVASWRLGRGVTVGDDAVTLLSSVALGGRGHLQQGVGGSFTFRTRPSDTAAASTNAIPPTANLLSA